MNNPEKNLQARYQPDYTGMTLRTFAYAEVPDMHERPTPQLADLIVGENTLRPAPVVLFLHGGGFMEPCDRQVAYVSFWARRLTQAGYAVVSADYPLYPEGTDLSNPATEIRGCEKAAQASHLLWQYLQTEGAALGLDPARIALMGSSAGSMGALCAAAQHPQRYRCVVACWGVPLTLTDATTLPPTFTVHGTADQLVPYARQEPLQKLLRAHRIPHVHIPLEGEGHTPLHRADIFTPPLLDFLRRYL